MYTERFRPNRRYESEDEPDDDYLHPEEDPDVLRFKADSLEEIGERFIEMAVEARAQAFDLEDSEDEDEQE